MGYELIKLSGYRAIGLKWEGKYSEIEPGLKNVIQQMEERAHELDFRVSPSVRLGLSYHVIEDGFVYYAVYEVSDKQEIPDGMVEILVPELTYLKTTHKSGGDIQDTYLELGKWIQINNYTPFKQPGVTYYDKYMPIKHEYYAIDSNKEYIQYDIYIPILVE